jgi:N-acetylglucosamine kinase-like BadF-type ATPase
VSQLLLAVDGGNSKTDVALLDDTGTVLSAVRGPTSAPIHLGLQGSMDCLDGLIGEALESAGLVASQGSTAPRPVAGVFALAGADLPHEEEALLHAVTARGWVGRAVVRNDAFALLRSGTDRPWGVAVVCGAGINCVGIGPDGSVARFPALGAISGDWGGGSDVGMAGLGAAVRSLDGRGPETLLAQTIPAYFDRPDAAALMTSIHVGEIAEGRLVELPPVVFAAVRAGDAEASAIVLRLAAEIAGCARAAIVRLGLQESDPQVVLGGGLLVAGLPLLDDSVRAGIEAAAPRASIHHVAVAPIVGAALLVLEEVSASTTAHQRVRTWGATYRAADAEVRA